MQKRIPIIAIGALPPPHNGMSVVFENFVKSNVSDKLELHILDISDNRSISAVGKLDLTNVFLALKHGYQFLSMILRNRPALVYLPIAQGTLGYLRDSLFLVPARILKIPIVVHLHGGEFKNFYHGSSKLMKKLIKFTLEKSKRAIVLGTNLKQEFEGLVPIESIAIVPNGIDVKCNHQIADDKQLCVTYLGALKYRKGYQEIIYSIPMILDAVPDVHFVFAGEICDLDIYEDVNDFILENELGKYIEFAGVVEGDAKYNLLGRSDIFCFPPVEPEGQPLVILEAMACGLPVVSTRQGAIPDLVENGHTGYVVEPGNRRELVSRIVELAQSTEMRKRMGIAGRERYLGSFTREKWVSRLLDILVNNNNEYK